MPQKGAYHVVKDVIQRTWYGFSYHVRVDWHTEGGYSVNWTILLANHDDCFKNIFKFNEPWGFGNWNWLVFIIIDRNIFFLRNVENPPPQRLVSSLYFKCGAGLESWAGLSLLSYYETRGLGWNWVLWWNMVKCGMIAATDYITASQ